MKTLTLKDHFESILKDLSEVKDPHDRKFSSILLIKYFDKYYICNRNQSCIFGLKKPDYMKWWGLPIGRIFNYTATDVKVICRFNGIGNERHRHQASLNIVKDEDVKKVYYAFDKYGIDNFAIEFAFRTQLNYYQLLKYHIYSFLDLIMPQ